MKTNKTLAAILAALMVAAAVFLGLSGKPVSRDGSLYVTDPADAISPSATQELLSMAAGRSARLSIAAVRSTGKLSTADYTEALWERWKMGPSDLLLVMVTGSAQDYYFGYDTGSDAGMVLNDIYGSLLDADLEPDFAAGDYSAAALTFAQGVYAALDGSGSSVTGGMTYPGDYDPAYDSGYDDGYGVSGGFDTILGFIILIVVVIILVSAITAVARIGRRRPRAHRPPRGPVMPPPPPRPMRRSRPIMPPPPPRPPRPMTPPPRPGAPRPGGFGGSSSRPSVPRPSAPRPSSRPSSGFGGGGRSSGSFGGGGRSSGGRSSFGGGGRSGGGFGGGGRGRK